MGFGKTTNYEKIKEAIDDGDSENQEDADSENEVDDDEMNDEQDFSDVRFRYPSVTLSQSLY